LKNDLEDLSSKFDKNGTPVIKGPGPTEANTIRI